MTLLAILLPGLAGFVLWFWAHQRWTWNEPAVIAGAGALVVLVLVLAGGLWWRGRELEAAQRRARAAEFVRDSLEAVADTIRVHELRTERGRRQVAERRAVQAELDRDAVDELLDTERRARVRAELRVSHLEADVRTLVAIDSLHPEVRLVDARIRQEPFTVRIRGEVPPAPLEARLRVSVALDPAEISVGVHCGPAGELGVRPARVSITTPDWLDVLQLEPELDPDVCSPPPPPPPGLLERIRIGVPYAAAGAAIAAVVVLVVK